jgi:hypothetical protein
VISAQLVNVQGLPLRAWKSGKESSYHSWYLQNKNNAKSVENVVVLLDLIQDGITGAFYQIVKSVRIHLGLNDQNFLPFGFLAHFQKPIDPFRELFFSVDLLQGEHLDVVGVSVQILTDVLLSPFGQ